MVEQNPNTQTQIPDDGSLASLRLQQIKYQQFKIMKARYQNKPEPIENIGYGKYYVNTNIAEIDVENEDGETVSEWECDQVTVLGIPTYEKTVVAMIREKYSENDELALLRQHATKADEFAMYNEYCENCKAVAKTLFGM